jgi:hypothetical protein
MSIPANGNGAVMAPRRIALGLMLVLAVTACGASASAQTLPNGARRVSGASVTPVFEGWFRNADGTFSFLIGYLNRNLEQEVDVPIGAGNAIEPGGPDRGQPTHFLTGRQWGLFTVTVPGDFGQQRLTWTIVANGQRLSIPFYLHPDYEISPLREAAVGNTPPVLAFEPGGRSVQGPLAMTIARGTTVTTPLLLTTWVSDDIKFTFSSGLRPRNFDNPVAVTWMKYRGAGAVAFDNPVPTLERVAAGGGAYNGKATTTVRFSAPGDYMLHVTVNDLSGQGGDGFQCCWTTALVKVSVAP